MGDGHWGPCEDKLKPLMDFTIDGVKGKAEEVKKIRQFIGCIFYRRHVRNFTESSAILTDLIKDNTPWKWTDEEKNKLEELREKICKAIPLGVPRLKGEIFFVSAVSNLGGAGTLFQWQALRPEQCHEIDERLRTQGVNRDGSPKHSYNEDEWRLVPLRHWNWKWNAARSKYHTYEHELLGGLLVLASQQRISGNNPVTWLCDQDSVKYFMDSPPPEQKRPRRWWVFLSQLRLAVHHIQGLKNELSDYLSRNSFEERLGQSSEEMAKDAFAKMDVQLDRFMKTTQPQNKLGKEELLKDYAAIMKQLQPGQVKLIAGE